MIHIGFESEREREREEVYTTLAVLVGAAIFAVAVLCWLTPAGSSLLTGLPQ